MFGRLFRSIRLQCSRTAAEYFVYFGTYTGFTYMNEGLPAGGSHSKGIYVSRFKPATGELSTPEVAAEIVNPAFLVVHPNQRFLYAATEDPLSRLVPISITHLM